MTGLIDWVSVCSAAERSSGDDASLLESQLDDNPKDLEARIKLIGFYTGVGSEERNEHIQWLISNHPDIDIGRYGRIDKDVAPGEYDEGKRLWLAAVARLPTDSRVLKNAVNYSWLHDSAMSEDLVMQGIALEPLAPMWHAMRGDLRATMASTADISDEDRLRCSREAAAEYERALNLSQTPFERFEQTLNLMKASLDAQAYGSAEELATQLLARAKVFETTWIYGEALHAAHIVLGQIALTRGYIAMAVEQLLAAGRTPGSPQLNAFGPDFDLAARILDSGQPNAVIEYLESCKTFWTRNVRALEQWQLAIKKGGSPTFKVWEGAD